MKHIGAIVGLLLLAACTASVKVPPVSVAQPPSTQKAPGNYAVLLQQGNWNLVAKSQTYGCSGLDFNVPIDRPYKTAMRQVVEATLERVTYIHKPLDTKKLESSGYTAQVQILQSNADASYRAVAGLLTPGAASIVNVTTTTKITTTDGTSIEFSSSGSGMSEKSIWVSCHEGNAAIANAAQMAVQTLADDTSRQMSIALKP